MDARSPDPDARRAMYELLLDCFNAEQFRRFVADVDPALTRELPGEACSDATVIDRGVDLLFRHARVDLNFFERWAQHRPKRRSQILSLAGEMESLAPRTAAIGSMGPSAAAAAAAPLQMAAPQAAGQDLDFWAVLALVLILVAVAVLFFALRADPFRVEYAIAAFLIGIAAVFVLLRHYTAALFAFVAGLLLVVWTGIRADRRAAIERT